MKRKQNTNLCEQILDITKLGQAVLPDVKVLSRFMLLFVCARLCVHTHTHTCEHTCHVNSVSIVHVDEFGK